jgi:hypothetical protein
MASSVALSFHESQRPADANGEPSCKAIAYGWFDFGIDLFRLVKPIGRNKAATALY